MGRNIFLSQFTGALLEWGGSSSTESHEARFKIGCVGQMYSAGDPLDMLGELGAVRLELQSRASAHVAQEIAATGSAAAEAQVLFASLLERCLQSNRIVCFSPSGIGWLPPSLDHCTRDDRAHAHRLSAIFSDRSVPIIGGFVEQLVTNIDFAPPFLEAHNHAFQPWDVVNVSGSPQRFNELAEEAESFVRTNLKQMLLKRAGHDSDPWLAKDGHQVSAIVFELCERLTL